MSINKLQEVRARHSLANQELLSHDTLLENIRNMAIALRSNTSGTFTAEDSEAIRRLLMSLYARIEVDNILLETNNEGV